MLTPSDGLQTLASTWSFNHFPSQTQPPLAVHRVMMPLPHFHPPPNYALIRFLSLPLPSAGGRIKNREQAPSCSSSGSGGRLPFPLVFFPHGYRSPACWLPEGAMTFPLQSLKQSHPSFNENSCFQEFSTLQNSCSHISPWLASLIGLFSRQTV